MKRWLAVGCVLLGCVACGGGSEPASDAASSSEAAPPGAQSPEAAVEAMQKMMQQTTSQAPAVQYEVLKAIIPAVTGWERGEVSGEQAAMMGISYSQAKAEYSKGDASINLEIVDTALIQALVMPFTMLASGGMDQRSDDGYRRGVKIGGNPGWEEWKNGNKAGEINVLVGGRFIVKGRGDGLPNMDPVKQVVEAVDMAKLAAAK